MTDSLVCIDASLLIKLVVPEPLSDRADALWGRWIRDSVEVVAPRLLHYEVTAVLRRRVHRRLLNEAEARAALDAALALELTLVDPDDLHARAWEMARRLGQPTTYDSHYLALAESLGCPFWTANERLCNAVRTSLTWVRWLGDPL
ncbi:MAG: type II toxin-antitoxin system VapC family toxin [Anaerolineae bacterium]|nr:type II toxin-antitoxin system VapC family toxin [Anaerolineae bacterium]